MDLRGTIGIYCSPKGDFIRISIYSKKEIEGLIGKPVWRTG
jgi:hypothetical protein